MRLNMLSPLPVFIQIERYTSPFQAERDDDGQRTAYQHKAETAQRARKLPVIEIIKHDQCHNQRHNQPMLIR